jgi:hypothetical protein
MTTRHVTRTEVRELRRLLTERGYTCTEGDQDSFEIWSHQTGPSTFVDVQIAVAEPEQ